MSEKMHEGNPTNSPKDELFSYHLVKLSVLKALQLLIYPPRSNSILGLKYSLCLAAMTPGAPVFSFSRYKLDTVAFVALWESEHALDQFLQTKLYPFDTQNAWHIRMRPYRRWGSLSGLNDAYLSTDSQPATSPVTALTVAKLRLSEAHRFTTWGKPVENQVNSHGGSTLTVVSMRPAQMFSTFSVWRNETEMVNMVNGGRKQIDGMNHKDAMNEQLKEPFHHEFITMRFQPIQEVGAFEGQTNFFRQT